jgi:hypothetical protein
MPVKFLKAIRLWSFTIALFFLFSSLHAAPEADRAARDLAQVRALAEAEAKAQTNTDKLETEERIETELPQKLDSYFRYMPSSKVEEQPGEVGIIAAESEYSYGYKAFNKLPVEFSLDTQYISIENTTAVELPAHLSGVSWGIETTLPFFKFSKTYLRLGVFPSFYSDDWNFDSSCFRIPARSLLIYKPSDKLTFIAGIAVYPDFEKEIWPVLGLIYQPSGKLTFNLVPKRPNITYSLTEKLALFAEGGLANSEFEVTKDETKNVVLRYQEARLAGGLKFKFNKFVHSSLAAGGIFNRALKYRDSLGKVNIKNGMYTEFRLEVKL